MVAAQEIAACSVRLVVASRVKAQRGSVRLQALKNASVGVGQATGAVVAAVKSCTQMVEAACKYYLYITQFTLSDVI